MKIDANIAINLLMARFNGFRQLDFWRINGRLAAFNSRRAPKQMDKEIHKVMGEYDKSGEANGTMPPVVRDIPVVDNDVWFIQSSLSWRSFAFLFGHRRGSRFRWQKWRGTALPIYVKWKGKWFVWNGTHRTVLCMLFQQKLRTRVIDLDAFVKWRKLNPNRRMWNVSRVINFGPKKGKKRGNRK